MLVALLSDAKCSLLIINVLLDDVMFHSSGGNWPATVALWLIDGLTWTGCVKNDTSCSAKMEVGLLSFIHFSQCYRALV